MNGILEILRPMILHSIIEIVACVACFRLEGELSLTQGPDIIDLIEHCGPQPGERDRWADGGGWWGRCERPSPYASALDRLCTFFAVWHVACVASAQKIVRVREVSGARESSPWGGIGSASYERVPRCVGTSTLMNSMVSKLSRYVQMSCGAWYEVGGWSLLCVSTIRRLLLRL